MPLQTLVGDDVLTAMCEMLAGLPAGAVIEVGVYKGGSGERLAAAAEKQGRPIFLYDTFKGIPCSEPDQGDFHKVGDFSDTSVEEVRAGIPYATVIQGLFPGSSVYDGPVAFVHLDVDQYRSYKEAIQFLKPLMVDGGVMWFDDYCLLGARKAIDEEFPDGVLTRCGKQYVVIRK